MPDVEQIGNAFFIDYPANKMVAITATTTAMATITTTAVMAAITVGGTPTADGFSWQSLLSVLSCSSFCFREFVQYTIYMSIVADIL